jgi:hypothetical protein
VGEFRKMIMPFGKYRGYEVEEMLFEYLEWLRLWENVELYGPLQDTVGDIVEEYPPPLVSDVDIDRIKSVYRRMARKWHPDAGRAVESMQAVNEFYEELQQSS